MFTKHELETILYTIEGYIQGKKKSTIMGGRND